MPRRFKVFAVLAVVLVFVASACSSDDKTTAAANAGASSSAAPKATGTINVSAAASLTEAFNDELATLETEQPDLTVVYNFGGSGMLVTQIQQGAEADVIATADTSSMQKLVDDGSVEGPVTFAHNKLEILVQPGNPKQIKGLSDLGRSDVIYVTQEDTVPAGKYSAQILGTAGVTVRPVSKELDVKAAVAKVASKEADVTIVYQTDVKAAGSTGQGVEIPDEQNVIAEYPIAVLKATKNPTGAQAFVDTMVSGSGQTALQGRGFLPA
jgi:molybdate transport system substrate-binding protein